jgi:predicted RND superfamily exporter protein/lauroyl/myristoyl acyltransferase
MKHPGRWLWLLLLVPVAIGLTRLRFDIEVFDLLPKGLSAVEGLKLYQQNFANARELLITLNGKDAEQTEAAARELAGELRAESNQVAGVMWQPPWQEHPEQTAELIAYIWLNQPPARFAELTNRLAPEKLGEVLSTAREDLASSMSPEEIARLSYDPYCLTRLPDEAGGAGPSFSQGQETFASPDGRFRLLFVQARDELRSYRDCQQFLDRVRDAVERALDGKPELSGVKVGYTGRPAFAAEIAQGMQHDITISVGGTAIIIAVLFWLAHRRIKPMLWLLTLLALILGSTLALGGLIYSAINVVSMGFAAILLGLAVDYAVVHYQEALAHPNLSIAQIRHAIAPSIFWAAVTTISAFLVLNFGGLPGLGQLGTLVGLGVTLAATIMIYEFLPPLFPGRNEPQIAASSPMASTKGTREPTRPAPWLLRQGSVVFGITALALALSIGVLCFGLPRVDPTANALRPGHSQAYEAMDAIQAHLSEHREPLWLLVGGNDVKQVGSRLERIQPLLEQAVSNEWITGFKLPTPLWPRPEFQTANRAKAQHLVNEGPLFRATALTNGFTAQAVGLTEGILRTWQTMAEVRGVYWPTNPMSRWIFEKFTARAHTNNLALGMIEGLEDPRARHAGVSALAQRLPKTNVWLSGWELLGSEIFSQVKSNMWKVLAPMLVLVLLSLFLAFRRPREILLSLAVLLMSGVCLLCVMRLAHWSWNLLNLMAIPLILGTGVDYSIFMQLALRRYGGDLDMAYRSVGRALLLCGGTAVAGFGSLALSSNAGMASLGQECAVGIGSNMLIAIFLLPVWWQSTIGTSPAPTKNSVPTPADSRTASSHGQGAAKSRHRSPPAGPSAFYRSEFWRLGLLLVRFIPAPVCRGVSSFFMTVYWLLARRRRQVVVQNLSPALGNDTTAAEKTAKVLFQQFAVKLVDLWRYEAGLPIDQLFGQTSGWEHFVAARERGRGILLVTPHLGNWEFGGPLLSLKGVALQVISLAEPGEAFTELRRASRARWKIETLVIGDDPFAFLEIIRRLEAGATVALLVDRPPPATAVTVQLFGRAFSASVAAAELARASGCVVLPVYMPRVKGTYAAHVLPAIAYERAALRDRTARQKFTQAVMDAFAPFIRRHLDQWYHFVPVWKNGAAGLTEDNSGRRKTETSGSGGEQPPPTVNREPQRVRLEDENLRAHE